MTGGPETQSELEVDNVVLQLIFGFHREMLVAVVLKLEMTKEVSTLAAATRKASRLCLPVSELGTRAVRRRNTVVHAVDPNRSIRGVARRSQAYRYGIRFGRRRRPCVRRQWRISIGQRRAVRGQISVHRDKWRASQRRVRSNAIVVAKEQIVAGGSVQHWIHGVKVVQRHAVCQRDIVAPAFQDMFSTQTGRASSHKGFAYDLTCHQARQDSSAHNW